MAEKDNILPFSTKGDAGQFSPGGLSSGSGGGTFDGMEARVEALEKKFDRIESKLDGIAIDLAFVKGKIEGLPSSYEFGQLKGRVDSLPTFAKMSAIIGVASFVILVLNNLATVKAFLLSQVG